MQIHVCTKDWTKKTAAPTCSHLSSQSCWGSFSARICSYLLTVSSLWCTLVWLTLEITSVFHLHCLSSSDGFRDFLKFWIMLSVLHTRKRKTLQGLMVWPSPGVALAEVSALHIRAVLFTFSGLSVRFFGRKIEKQATKTYLYMYMNKIMITLCMYSEGEMSKRSSEWMKIRCGAFVWLTVGFHILSHASAFPNVSRDKAK